MRRNSVIIRDAGCCCGRDDGGDDGAGDGGDGGAVTQKG